VWQEPRTEENKSSTKTALKCPIQTPAKCNPSHDKKSKIERGRVHRFQNMLYVMVLTIKCSVGGIGEVSESDSDSTYGHEGCFALDTSRGNALASWDLAVEAFPEIVLLTMTN